MNPPQQKDKHSNIEREQKIFRISIIGSIIFPIVELIIANISGSRAVMMDVVFSIADVIMLGPILMLIPLLYEPTSDKRPFGFSQVESMFLLVKCGLLTTITIYLIVSSVKTILAGGNDIDGGIVAAFELIASLVCFIFFMVLSHMNKKVSSPSVDTEIYIWKLDSLTALGMGIAFCIQPILKNTGAESIVPFVDPVIAIVLAGILLIEPVRMLVSAIRSLILFAPQDEIIKKVHEATDRRLDEVGYKSNDIDILTTGRKTWIEIYVFPKEGDDINLSIMRNACMKITEDIKDLFDELDVEMSMDLDEAESVKATRRGLKRKPDSTRRMRRGSS